MASSSLIGVKHKAIDEFLSVCLKQNIPVDGSTETYTGIMIVLTELLKRTKPDA